MDTVKQTTTNESSINNNYAEIVPMTFEERYKMYMRCKKEELAKMLAQRDEYDHFLKPYYPPTYPQYPQYPTYPEPNITPYPLNPWVTYTTNIDEQTNIS